MNDGIDTEPCKRLIEPVKEHEVLAGMSGNERFQNVRGTRPNGTPACLVTFAHQPYRGRGAPGDVTHGQMSSLVSARPGVIEEQQQSVISHTQCRMQVRRLQ